MAFNPYRVNTQTAPVQQPANQLDERYLQFVNQAPITQAQNSQVAALQQQRGGMDLQTMKKRFEDSLAGATDESSRQYYQNQLDLINQAPELQQAADTQRQEATNLQARAEGTATADQSALIKNSQQQGQQNLALASQMARMAPSATGAGAMRAVQRAKAQQTQSNAQSDKIARLSDMLAVRQQLGKEAFAQEGVAVQAQMEADLAAAQQQQKIMGSALQGFGAFLARGSGKPKPDFNNLDKGYDLGATNAPIYDPNRINS